MGWIARDDAPWGRTIWHNGSNTMWYCVAWLAPEAKFGVLVVCNDGGGAQACDDVGRGAGRYREMNFLKT